MEIKKDFKNSLFKRQEITGELESEKNPSFDEVKKFIAEKLKKPEETIEIRTVKGGFGNHVFHVDAHVYDSQEDLNDMKQLTKTKKQRTEEAKESAKPAEEKPAEETTPTENEEAPAPTETPAEEKPADETPTEDKPEEETKEVKEETQKAEEAKEN